MNFPGFDAYLPGLNRLVNGLVRQYQSGDIKSWADLEKKVKTYFTPARMDQMEAVVPGWQTMASYSDGITLVHVMCVFLGLFMLPEFQRLTPEQKQLAKWIVLFHDVDKFHIRGKKDTMHAFRSTVHGHASCRHLASGQLIFIMNGWSPGANILSGPSSTGMKTPHPRLIIKSFRKSWQVVNNYMGRRLRQL